MKPVLKNAVRHEFYCQNKEADPRNIMYVPPAGFSVLHLNWIHFLF